MPKGMVENTVSKTHQQKRENKMSKSTLQNPVMIIHNRVSDLNRKAKEKGFEDNFIMIQSDGVNILFYGYFFETENKILEKEIESISKDLDMIEYSLDNFNLI